MTQSEIKLEAVTLKQIIKAYIEIDEVTDDIQAIYGTIKGEPAKLNSVWSDLHDVLEYHFGEGQVEQTVTHFKITGELP